MFTEALDTTGQLFQPLLPAVISQMVDMFNKTLLAPFLRTCADILSTNDSHYPLAEDLTCIAVFGKTYNAETLSSFIAALANRTFSHLNKGSVIYSFFCYLAN